MKGGGGVPKNKRAQIRRKALKAQLQTEQSETPFQELQAQINNIDSQLQLLTRETEA